MFGKRKLMEIAAAGVLFFLCQMTVSTQVCAETAGELFLSESAGASVVFNTNAYNEASLDKVGIEEPVEVVEIESSDLVMAHVSSVLNVRAEGNVDSKKVGKLYKDCGGLVLERGEEWSLIQSGDLVGWANNEYLYFDEEAIELAKKVGASFAEIKSDCVAVRGEADEKSGLLGYAAKGAIFEMIYETDDDWVCIAYDEMDGFVKKDLINYQFEIDHGETMAAINARKQAALEAKRKLTQQKEAIEADEDTLRLLAALIWCEARGEPYEGMVAVGAVVMNRVRSKAYPDTVYDVIFASGQFSPVKSGALYKAYNNNANPLCYQAAQEALDGFTNVGEMTHFRRKGNKEGYVIGNHVFY